MPALSSRRLFTSTLLLLSFLLSFLLSSAPIAASPADVESFSSEHFVYHAHGDLPARFMWDIQQKLEENRGRILSELGVPDLPRVDVHIYESIRGFKTASQEAARGGSHEASSFYGAGGDGPVIGILHTGQEDLAEVLHQFTHIVTGTINPRLWESSPWLFESIALYQARQFHPPSQLSCITLSEVPSIHSLNVAANREILRRVGFLLGDYIANKYESDGFLSLIRHDGDVTHAFDVPEEDFERDWHQFTANRYLADNQVPPIISTLRINREIIGNTFYFDDGRNFYLEEDHDLHMAQGDVVQAGNWMLKGGTRVCWKILNFDEYCTEYRMSGDRFWLDTSHDCKRYSLRRAIGNAEGY